MNTKLLANMVLAIALVLGASTVASQAEAAKNEIRQSYVWHGSFTPH